MDRVPMSNSLVVSKHLDPRLVSHCHVGATFRSVMLVTKRCHAHKTVCHPSLYDNVIVLFLSSL